jgi:hypothetical protein
MDRQGHKGAAAGVVASGGSSGVPMEGLSLYYRRIAEERDRAHTAVGHHVSWLHNFRRELTSAAGGGAGADAAPTRGPTNADPLASVSVSSSSRPPARERESSITRENLATAADLLARSGGSGEGGLNSNSASGASMSYPQVV